MKRTILAGTASLLALLLPACGGADQADNNLAEANDMNAMMAGSGPFADVEMRMNQAMMAAVGTNAGDSWVRKMIAHHRGAVEMARQTLTMNPDAHVAGMAQDTIDKQTREIASLETLVAQGTSDPASAELYRPAMDRMHNAMMAANGANLSETFHRKMLEHHKGAVAMSDVALANGVTGAVRAQVEKTRDSQLKEIAAIEAMLRGEPAPSAPAATAPGAPARTAEPAATKPAPPKAAPPKPKAPEPKPQPEPADPHAGHDMNNMSN